MKKFLVSILALTFSCNKNDTTLAGINFREEMRTFVGEISIYARNLDPNFIIIPQNGVELVTLNGNENGPAATMYLSNIDAVGQEDLYYGFEADNKKSPPSESDYLVAFLNVVRDNGKAVLVTDYCSDPSKMDDSYLLNKAKQYISYAAPDRELRVIPIYPPAPRDSNERNINRINDADNFLYLINPEKFDSKQAFIDAIAATNYDVIIMDAFFNGQIWQPQEVAALKTKANGGARLVLSYMSIGEAEDYRYYWQPEYSTNAPEWLSGANPDWPGNYKVKYWLASWKAIIYGNNEAYLDKLLEAGFDGAYLDIIDGYAYFESL
jgi:cysteinyl-tRNA synthetase, unknown class